MATIPVRAEKEVTYLKADMHVRYWDDGEVNGVRESEDGGLMPLRKGDMWQLVIELASGKILGWPQGTTAKVHYKVVDEGRYALLGPDMQEEGVLEGYVIGMMCPEGNGYGDYVKMKIDENGIIQKWEMDLEPFFEF